MSPNSNATNRSHHPMTDLHITQEQYENDIRAAKAQAWSEGYKAGNHPFKIDNPYEEPAE